MSGSKIKNKYKKQNKKISENYWIKDWWGEFSYLSSSYCFDAYYKSSKKLFGKYLSSVLLSNRKGIIACYLSESELENYGDYLAKKLEKNKTLCNKWSEQLKKETDNLRKIIKSPKRLKNFLKFDKALIRFVPFQILNRAIANHLQSNDVCFRILEDARKYSERVFNETEIFIEELTKEIAKKEKINPKYLSTLIRKETYKYLKSGKLPSLKKLKQRYTLSGMYFHNGKIEFIGSEIEKIEDKLYKKQIASKTIKGKIAFVGKVVGRCKILFNLDNPREFNKGDILVTPMTAPDFLPLIKKAKAIITDAGGILCHAAIISRELGIPCIIGTKIATKVLKDGDLVEVDANKGTVKILK